MFLFAFTLAPWTCTFLHAQLPIYSSMQLPACFLLLALVGVIQRTKNKLKSQESVMHQPHFGLKRVGPSEKNT